MSSCKSSEAGNGQYKENPQAKWLQQGLQDETDRRALSARKLTQEEPRQENVGARLRWEEGRGQGSQWRACCEARSSQTDGLESRVPPTHDDDLLKFARGNGHAGGKAVQRRCSLHPWLRRASYKQRPTNPPTGRTAAQQQPRRTPTTRMERYGPGEDTYLNTPTAPRGGQLPAAVLEGAGPGESFSSLHLSALLKTSTCHFHGKQKLYKPATAQAESHPQQPPPPPKLALLRLPAFPQLASRGLPTFAALLSSDWESRAEARARWGQAPPPQHAALLRAPGAGGDSGRQGPLEATATSALYVSSSYPGSANGLGWVKTPFQS